MSDKATAARYDAGTEIEYKPGPGLGGWRPGTVVADEGGRIVEVRALRPGAVPLLVRRSLVRLAPAASPVDTRRAVSAIQAARHSAEASALRVVSFGAPVAIGPKPRGRLYSSLYLAYVRALPCCSCGTLRGVEAHHAGPRPVGRKADDFRGVPLCARCHAHLHRTGALLGRPLVVGEDVDPALARRLERAEVRAFLFNLQAEMLIEYFAAGAELEGAPAELEAPRAAEGGR